MFGLLLYLLHLVRYWGWLCLCILYIEENPPTKFSTKSFSHISSLLPWQVLLSSSLFFHCLWSSLVWALVFWVHSLWTTRSWSLMVSMMYPSITSFSLSTLLMRHCPGPHVFMFTGFFHVQTMLEVMPSKY